MNDAESSREALTREADRVRSHLFRTVERLDQRRRDALDLEHQIVAHAKGLALGATVVLLAAGAGAWIAVRHAAAVRPRRRLLRFRLAKDVWRHPDRALRARRASLPVEVLRSVVLSIASAALAIPIKRIVEQLVAPERAGVSPLAPSPRLAMPPPPFVRRER